MNKKNDDFFKEIASNNLTKKILNSAQIELEHNRQRKKSKIWFLIVGPLVAAVAASFFVFKINIAPTSSSPEAVSGLMVFEDVSEEVLNTAEHIELVSDFGDDAEIVEIVDDLGFLQEFEDIELISEEELEG